MISNMQVDEWLRAHTRMTERGLVWPRGTLYSYGMSRKIAHTYLSLGLTPDESVSIDLVQSLVHRLEVLEHALAEFQRRAEAATPAWVKEWPRQAGKTSELDKQFAATVLGVKAGDVIREGDPRMNLVQDLIEGDGPRQDWAKRVLDAVSGMTETERTAYIEGHPFPGVCDLCEHVDHVDRPGERCGAYDASDPLARRAGNRCQCVYTLKEIRSEAP